MDIDAEQFLSTSVENGLATLKLNRPGLNILHVPMLQQLEAALAGLSRDETIRLLVLRGAGKFFSAGVDVGDHTADKVGEMIPLFDRVCWDLAAFPTPTLAVVHGHALGGGCELVLCCDLAVMAEGAKIGQPEIQLATLAPVAALLLPAQIGYRKAADLLFTGRTIDAQEAQQIGLVNAAVPPEELDAWVDQKTGQLLGLSRAALTLLKRALRMGRGDWSRAIPEIERLYLDELMATEDAIEGVNAFIEKRTPAWKHH